MQLTTLLLYDDAQSIYRKSRGLDFSLSSVGIKAAGRTSILRLNYRNTREILQFACDFASQFLDAKAADDDPIPMVLPETGGSSGPGPAAPRRRSEIVDGRWWMAALGLNPNGVKHPSPGQRPGSPPAKAPRFPGAKHLPSSPVLCLVS